MNPDDLSSTVPSPAPRCRILVLAVGGGACASLSAIARDWSPAPVLAALNTDRVSLDATGIPLTIPLGPDVAGGRGAAGDPTVGRMAAEESLDAVRSLLPGHDLLLLLACLGGGTGSGAAPVVARLARENGLLTLAFVTTPFAFEGLRRSDCASEALSLLKRNADSVVVLPNESLHALLPENASLSDAYAYVDRMMAAAIRGLWVLLTRDNLLNLDFADIQALVEHSGNECRFAYGEGRGPDRAALALQSLLQSPMLENGRVLANSGSVLLNIAGGADNPVTLTEMNTIQQGLKTVLRPGASLRIGAMTLQNWDDTLAVTVLAADRGAPPPLPPAAPPSTVTARRPARRSKTPPQPELHLVLESDAPSPASSATPSPSAPAPRPASPVDDLDTPTYIRRGVRIPS